MNLDWILDTRELIISLGVITSLSQENIPVLRRYMLKYLGAKCFDACNLLSNNSEKSV